MWAWQGEEFTAAVLDGYRLLLDAGVRDRIRYRGLWLALLIMGHGIDNGLPQCVKLGTDCLCREFSSE